MPNEYRSRIAVLVMLLVAMLGAGASVSHVIPLFMGLVILTSAILTFPEMRRGELRHSLILRTVVNLQEQTPTTIVYGAVGLTIGQMFLLFLSTNTSLRVDQQQAFEFAFSVLVAAELVVMGILALGHVLLRAKLMGMSARVGTFALTCLFASAVFLSTGLPVLYVSGPLLVVGYCVYTIGLLIEGDAGANDVVKLVILWLIVMIAAMAFSGNVATVICVGEICAATVFAFLGGLLIFRKKVFDQEKVEIH